MTNPPTSPRETVTTPDPSVLTTQQLQRELASLKEIINTRLDGMDVAVELLQANVNKVPSDTDRAIAHLQSLHEEKFQTVRNQFIALDSQTNKISELNQKALDAALLTAEKAVGKQNEASSLSIAKSEAATKEKIDQQGILLQTETKGLTKRIDDLKERLDRGDGHTKGMGDGWGYIVGAIGAIAGLAGIVALLIR